MNELYKIFVNNLKPLGCSRLRGNFYLDTDELIIVVNLQKALYSNKYYINIAFWIKSIDAQNYKPLYYKCHIYFRAESYYKNDPEVLDVSKLALELFNFDACGIEFKSNAIDSFVKKYICNILNDNNTLEGLRKSYREHRIANEMICLNAKNLLASDEIPQGGSMPCKLREPSNRAFVSYNTSYGQSFRPPAGKAALTPIRDFFDKYTLHDQLDRFEMTLYETPGHDAGEEWLSFFSKMYGSGKAHGWKRHDFEDRDEYQWRWRLPLSEAERCLDWIAAQKHPPATCSYHFPSMSLWYKFVWKSPKTGAALPFQNINWEVSNQSEQSRIGLHFGKPGWASLDLVFPFETGCPELAMLIDAINTNLFVKLSSKNFRLNTPTKAGGYMVRKFVP